LESEIFVEGDAGAPWKFLKKGKFGKVGSPLSESSPSDKHVFRKRKASYAAQIHSRRKQVRGEEPAATLPFP